VIDGPRGTGSREFQVFAKPAGAVCNLDCAYCYYLEKQALFPDSSSHRMSKDLLDRYIRQHMDISSGKVVRFSWHGGEPTTLGIDYFQTIVTLQKRHAPQQKQVKNALVTNGTLLNEEWCEFLRSEGFAVGLSLDGPPQIHDAYRLNRKRQPTHAKVMRGLELLQRFEVPHDILCVVSSTSTLHGIEVYRFFKEVGATYVGFLPLVARGPGDPDFLEECSVSPEGYGEFLCTIFDEWVRNDIGRILVQNFDEAARPIRGLEHALCIFRETCGDIPVVEHNGDVFSCDHFVTREHLLGNIVEHDLSELLFSVRHERFGDSKRDSLPHHCRQCEVLSMCNGGCPKDRFVRTPDGEDGLNYLCPAFKMFFSHCRPVFEKLVPLWKQGATAEQLMSAARGERPAGRARVGRNDPCPCGSGRKYKRCCMGSGKQGAGSRN